MECITPHMCTVCWINDHMYCKNMRRVGSDLPCFMPCIHYIPCAHFRTTSSLLSVSGESVLANTSNDEMNTSHMTCFRWNTNELVGVDSGRKLESAVVSEEDLLCKEEMMESDSSNHSTEGTEILQIQLKARSAQIFKSLGVAQLPNSTSPTLPTDVATSITGPNNLEDEDDSMVNIEPAEYAAEVCIADEDSDNDSSDDDVVICAVEFKGRAVHKSSDLKTGHNLYSNCNEDFIKDEIDLFGDNQLNVLANAAATEKLEKQSNTSKYNTGDKGLAHSTSECAETLLKKSKVMKTPDCLEVCN